ncbi:hypothetical protein P9B03_14130 [Metasolibacillus meyeri]|uniref:ABC transporter permease n=1 Tax=Metasolibacillus meyeri TaxID=1071052 RepID=A0AAW9NVX8_9BACL|nr:hypothetical protein [Metasolibacillus meyeri]MEC1179634.1 hypothetical protein [Metasolibacillus meyeri]
MFINTLKYHLHSLIKPIHIWGLIATFLSYTFFVHTMYEEIMPSTTFKVLAFTFYFPIYSNLDVFRWLLLIVPLLVMIGNFMTSEIKERGIFVLLHVGSYHMWFHSLMLSVLLFTFFYFLFGFISIGFISWFLATPNGGEIALPFFNKMATSYLIGHEFFLLIFVAILLVWISIFLTFLLNQAALATILTIICSSAVQIGNYIAPNLMSYLPLTYSFLAFREMHHLPFRWSYLLILLSLMIIYLFAYIYFLKKNETIF